MTEKLKIGVFGATGNLGDHFVRQAIDAGYHLRALVRNESKFKYRQHPNIKVLVGDASKSDAVTQVIEGVDVVVSCLGNVNKVRIMETAHSNILTAAAEQKNMPRCIFISSIGCGGTSLVIKILLIMIGGKSSFADYEAADKRIREELVVPRLLVRPSALTNKPGRGVYKIIEKQAGTFTKPISRSDLATFLVKAVEDSTWDGKPGIQLVGK